MRVTYLLFPFDFIRAPLEEARVAGNGSRDTAEYIEEPRDL